MITWADEENMKTKKNKTNKQNKKLHAKPSTFVISGRPWTRFHPSTVKKISARLPESGIMLSCLPVSQHMYVIAKISWSLKRFPRYPVEVACVAHPIKVLNNANHYRDGKCSLLQSRSHPPNGLYVNLLEYFLEITAEVYSYGSFRHLPWDEPFLL